MVSVFAFAKAYTAPIDTMPCATLSSPVEGATNVPVEATINWNPELDVFGYSISLGTTVGGTDIANNVSVGVTPSFTPPLGLPESTTIFVTISVLIDQTTTVVCDSQSFTTTNVTTPPGCSQLTSPTNGAIDISVDPILQWSYAPRATGYLITIGTTPGATDVLNGLDVGNTLNFNVTPDLNPNTTYYVTIIPYNENGQTLGCSETSFTTEDIVTEPPPCTTIITPEDGATEVALTPLISWNPVSEATGYRITIGTTPGGTDVLDFADIGNTTATLVLDFDEGTTYYITIFPYNDAGTAQGCTQTSFTTTLGCGPYEDVITGEIVDLNPIITLEESYDICVSDPPLELSQAGVADTFTWVQVIDGEERTIATQATVTITEGGVYRLYVTEEVLIDAGFITCSAAAQFVVFQSEAPTIETISFQNQGLDASVNVIATGGGDYEYAIGSIDGPYQDSPQFTNVSFSNIEVFVRDKNGCGFATQRIDPDLGFPKYFTPNGDGINDLWQVRGVVVNGQRITRIEVFDRYGKRVADFSPLSAGWDGTFNGRRLLDAGFWYKATTDKNTTLTGYFALRRG